MTNKLQQITTLALATILIAGTLSLMPIAYSTGSNYGNNHWDHDDDDDDNHDSQKIKICHIPPGNPNNAHTITISKSAWDAHKTHGDYKGKCNNDDDDREDCKCRKPSTLTVRYNGPPGAVVDIEIYKKIEDVGSPQKKLQTVLQISNDNTVKINSNTFGKETLEANTIYRVMQGTTQLAVVTIHTSCSQPLFIGKQYTNNQVTLTLLSGEDSNGKQSIFLEHDPICEGAKLTVTKIVDDPPMNSGKFILKISKDGNPVYQSAELGNGESTGPQALMPGTYTVDESSVGTNLDDYIRTIGGDCNRDGSIELEKGDKAECIITNTRIQPATMTIKKVITQDNTDEAEEIDLDVENPFHFFITNTESGSDPIEITTPNQAVPPGTYTLREDQPDNFDFVLITGDDGCPTMVEDMEEFTLSSGEHLTCVVYNEDDADASSGGGAGIVFRPTHVTFVPGESSTYSLPDGGGDVTIDVTSDEIIVIDPAFNAPDATSLIIIYTLIDTSPSGQPIQCVSEGIIAVGSVNGFRLACPFGLPGDEYALNYALINTIDIT